MKRLFLFLIFVACAGLVNAQKGKAATEPIPVCTDTAVTVFEVSGAVNFAEQMPEYPGGESGLMNFVAKKLRYPTAERDLAVTGRVIVRFVVNEDGAVTDATIVRSVSTGIDAEAIRVVKLLKKFKPGRINGQPVKVFYNLPIQFKLN